MKWDDEGIWDGTFGPRDLVIAGPLMLLCILGAFVLLKGQEPVYRLGLWLAAWL